MRVVRELQAFESLGCDRDGAADLRNIQVFGPAGGVLGAVPEQMSKAHFDASKHPDVEACE